MNQPVVTPGDGFVPGATNRAAIQTLFISNDEVTQTELSSIGEVIKARAADAKQYSAAKHRYRIEYAGYNMQTEPAGLTLAAGD